MRPSLRHGNACRIISLHAPSWRDEWLIIQSFYHELIHSAREHIYAAAGGSFFALSIEEARKLVEKMTSKQSWDEEHSQTRTRKVHQLEEVDIKGLPRGGRPAKEGGQGVSPCGHCPSTLSQSDGG
jgi:hypothetical protein